MKIAEFLKKTTAAVSAPVRTVLAERSAAEQYAKDMAAWEQKRREAIAAIREKLNDPLWYPRSLHPTLGIGPPPVNPNAGITLHPQTYTNQDQE